VGDVVTQTKCRAALPECQQLKHLPEFRDTAKGIRRRERLAAGAFTEEEWTVIPKELQEVYRCAKSSGGQK
jgi:hypothetical protein